jgi:hypothetical protein
VKRRGRRRAATPAAPPDPPQVSGRRAAAVACGLVLLLFAAFVAPMNLRDLCIFLNRAEYLPDQLELESYSEGAGGDGATSRLEGHLVSSGEGFVDSHEGLLPGGLEEVRRLKREGRLIGHRVPVAYLPKQGLWRVVDRINRFRVVTPEELAGQGAVAGAGLAAALWLGGILLFRRGAWPARP